MTSGVMVLIECPAGASIGDFCRDLTKIATKLDVPVVCRCPTPGNSLTRAIAYPHDDAVDLERSYWFRYQSDFPLLTAADGQNCPMSDEDLGMAMRQYKDVS